MNALNLLGSTDLLNLRPGDPNMPGARRAP